MRSPLRRPSTLAATRVAAGWALFFLVAIVVTGATVRLTGSGLGCPNWPSCTTTRPVPEVEYHALIEFFNRMVSLPTTIATLATLVLAWRLPARRPDLRLGSALVVLGVLVQVVLGALTVRLELPPLVVAAHFLVSVAILAAATFTWLAARSERPLRLRRPLAPVAVATSVVMLASLLAVIVAGVATTAAGPHSGAEPGQLIERLGGGQLAVTLHARGAYAFAVLVLLLVAWRLRTRAGARDLGVLAALVAGQIALGEVQYRSGLPWEVVLAHVTNATALWTLACGIAVRASFHADAAAPDLPAAPSTGQAAPAPAPREPALT